MQGHEYLCQKVGSVFSCVPFCLRSLGRLEKCVITSQNHFLFSGFLPYVGKVLVQDMNAVVCTKGLFTPFHSPLSVIGVSITRLNIILADRQLAIYKRKWPKRLLAISVIESCLYISYFFFTSFS